MVLLIGTWWIGVVNQLVNGGHWSGYDESLVNEWGLQLIGEVCRSRMGTAN